MSKKRILSLLVILCIVATSLAGCAGNTSGKTEETSTVTETKETAAIEYRIVQDRVIELTYNEFDADKAVEYMNNKYDNFDQGGCSAMKVLLDDKVYVGRNYDFYCSDTPAFIVKNNAGKYRTIGIGNSPATLPEWTDDYKLSDDLMKVLPIICCDVMSEAGIYVETNIRVSEEDLACSSTNPGAPRRCTQTFMQTMLSEYGTIQEILDHIDDYDWFDLKEMGFNQSFLLTDKTGYSVVLEFAADSWTATESDYNANYFIADKYYENEKYPIGQERITRISASKESVKTPEDIFTMMGVAAYSQFYTNTVDIDYAIGEYTKELGYTRFNIDENREDARIKMKAMLDEYNTYTWEQLVENHCWESTFTTVANVSDLNLNVHFSEHYGIKFTVTFD